VAEGDTILRTASRLRPALAGEQVTIRTPNPRGRAAGVQRLDGRVCEGVDSHGKHLLLRFEGDLVLHSHLGMSGSWQLYPPGAAWRRPPRSAWVVLGTERAEAVQFGGPTLRVLPAGRVGIDPTLGRLGPDILDEGFTAAEGTAALRRAGSDRGLGDALLDQRLLAGVGNIFKSEGCFAAAVSPWHRLDELSDEQLGIVVESTRDLMREAVRSGRPPRAVYKRPGEPCPRCGTRLRSHGQGDANRTTYWCPGCQA
jgi:endonuclease-8